MNKKDLSLIVALILLIPIWLFIDSRFIKPFFPDAPVPAPASTESPADNVSETPSVPPAVESSDTAPAIVPGSPVTLEVSDAPEANDIEAEKVTLRNEVVEIVLSNLGASVLSADLFEYPATLADKDKENGEIVKLDFSEVPFHALTYNMTGLNASSVFTVSGASAGAVTFSREIYPGLVFERKVTLVDDSYEMKVVDRWINHTQTPISVPKVDLYLGPMYPREEISQKFGPFVGIDARHPSPGPGIKHYVKTLRKNVGKVEGMFEETIPFASDWVGVKNKFFTQVLSLEEDPNATGMVSLTLRAKAGEEGAAAIGFAQPYVTLEELSILPEQVVERNFSYYVGPISMDNLKALGGKQEELIDFRLFRFIVPLGKLMMSGLNKLYDLTGNWGISIILLTFVVRMLFWPLTQKGAENMKRMSELSPQMKALKEKHKNNQQKLQVEMQALYKENKVNPMAGCLPMLVQIPVFISLYGVLRVAVELRFAEFLWVKDLSEQEALFFIAGFPVNILPLTMGATMVLQQRLTPSNMEEQQKKIMMMMPIVFLFICYNMPAGLLLYWTTSNLISIYQTTHTRRRDAKKAGQSGDPKTPKGGKLPSVKNPKASPAKAKKG